MDAESPIHFVPRRKRPGVRIALLRTPFFSPLSPPLGLGMLKAYLQQHGHAAVCHDYNVDPALWDTQRRYFAAVEAADGSRSKDGQSKLWAVINAHMHAFVAGASRARCVELVRTIAPLHALAIPAATANTLQDLLEAFFGHLGQRLDELDLGTFDFVGCSTYTTSLPSSLFALRRLKQRYPALRTIMGGGVFADDLATGSDNLQTLLREFDFVDHAVLGEGELLLRRLVEGSFVHKRAISLADLGGEKLDITTLPPPDFTDLRMDRYFHLSIEGGRSCPFQCSFCSETIQWGDYRMKNRGTLAQQMMGMARDYRKPRFFMGDSLVNPYINALSEQLLELPVTLQLDGYLRADKAVTSPERVEMWSRAGLYRARLGLETAAPHMLEIMDKRTTPETMLSVLRNLTDHGVRTTTYWVVGFPGETEQDFEQTLEFVREAHPFIYELEAHPYYYYPYGQVASRLFETVPLYPDEVTSLIKFKTWDVAGASPDREQRFERLRRMAELAARLKIPNIYSLAEYHEAEARWLRLSGAAARQPA
jgi:hypothetical protein